MTPEQQQSQIPTLELINSEVASRMSRQTDSGAKIDTKAVFLIGFVATATQFLAAKESQPALAALAFAAYAFAAGFGIAIVHLAGYDDITPRQLVDQHARSELGHVLLELAATRVAMFERNRLVHVRKARCWTWSLLCAALGIALSTAAILLQH